MKHLQFVNALDQHQILENSNESVTFQKEDGNFSKEISRSLYNFENQENIKSDEILE